MKQILVGFEYELSPLVRYAATQPTYDNKLLRDAKIIAYADAMLKNKGTPLANLYAELMAAECR